MFAIEAAKEGKLSPDLEKRLDAKINLNSLSDYEKEKIKSEIISKINEKNASDELCKNQNGELELMNFHQFVSSIAKK